MKLIWLWKLHAWCSRNINLFSTHIIINRNRDREVRTPMRQSKRRGPLCRVSTPRREVMTCIKDVVRRSQYVKRNKMRDLGDCRWTLKRAFKVGGIVTHPRVPGDASVVFSDEMLAWVINRRSARIRMNQNGSRCSLRRTERGTAESRVRGKSAKNLNLKVRWHRLTAYKSLRDFLPPHSQRRPLRPLSHRRHSHRRRWRRYLVCVPTSREKILLSCESSATPEAWIKTAPTKTHYRDNEIG